MHRVLAGWIERVLPGYTIERKKITKRGPRDKWYPWDKTQLVIDYENLSGTLKEWVGKYEIRSLKIQGASSRNDHVKRIAKLVQNLNIHAGYRLPLPNNIATEIAHTAIGKKVFTEAIVYGLLKHYYKNQTKGSLRRIIERSRH